MLKVATYARVSTKLDSQKSSIENQGDFFDRLLNKKKDEWMLFHNYIDNGKSGTSRESRKNFNKMIEDAKQKKFDILIAKSMTRFGRNRADTSNVLEKILFPLGIRVIFYEEKLDSDIREDRAKMGLFEWLAEVESRKISDRMIWQRDQLQEKGLFAGNRSPYGYNLINHRLVINEEEARVVRMIYSLYLQGYGLYKIVDYLNDNGYKPRTAKKWSRTTLVIILSNGNYTGNLYQKKTKTKDPISKEIIYFKKEDWIETKNTHEAIIDEKTFLQVQSERATRKELTNNKIKYSGVNLFSNMIKCGRCGSVYIRKKTHDKYVYSCSEYERRGTKGCKREAINEEDLIDYLKVFIDNLLNDKNALENIYNKYADNYVNNPNKLQKELKQLGKELDKLKEKHFKLMDSYFGDNKMGLTEEQYLKLNSNIQNEISKLSDEKISKENHLTIKRDLDSMYIRFKKELKNLANIENWNNKKLRDFFPIIIINNKEDIKIKINLQEYQNRKCNQLNVCYIGTEIYGVLA